MTTKNPEEFIRAQLANIKFQALTSEPVAFESEKLFKSAPDFTEKNVITLITSDSDQNVYTNFQEEGNPAEEDPNQFAKALSLSKVLQSISGQKELIKTCRARLDERDSIQIRIIFNNGAVGLLAITGNSAFKDLSDEGSAKNITFTIDGNKSSQASRFIERKNMEFFVNQYPYELTL